MPVGVANKASTRPVVKRLDRRRAIAIGLVGLLVGHAPLGAKGRYEQGRPSADGIGKRYLGREIAQVMGWQGAAWLERAEREQEERTDLLLAELRLVPGQIVADIGAGTGYLSRRMATQVAPGGRVFAVDVQPEMLRLLQASAVREGLTQIVPVLAAVDDVHLPAGSVDLAIMVDVYHELEFPYEVLASIVTALKPDGRIAFVAESLPWQHIVVFRKR